MVDCCLAAGDWGHTRTYVPVIRQAAIPSNEVTSLIKQAILDHPHSPETITEPEVGADLEQAADKLLSQHLVLGSDSGVYSQAQIDRRTREQDKRMPRMSECGISADMTDALLERRIEELTDAANLTALQEIIYRLHVAGFSPRGIASAVGLRFGSVRWRLREVKRKIRRAYEEGIYAGWYEVYLSEVSRPVYRRRRN